MRFLVLLLVFSLSCAFDARGQDTPLGSLPNQQKESGSVGGLPQEETDSSAHLDQNALPKVPETTKEGADISKATDGQIDEAQRFYKACSDNEQMNSQHDCKCLAGEYLVARISRGDAASHKQVFSDIRKLCLKTPEDKSDLADEEEADPGKEEFTEAEIKEATQVYEWCKADTFMPLYHDCKCLASEFVTKRREMGRLPNWAHVVSELKNKCLDGTQMAGYLYNDCITKPNMLPMHIKDVKKFCECYASKFSKNYEGLEGGNVSINETGAIARQSMNQCQNEQRTFTLK